MNKRKKWLTEVISETRGRLHKAQERYNRLRKNSEKLMRGDNIFLRVERKEEKKTRQKLAPIVEGPFPVLWVNDEAKKVLIKRPENMRNMFHGATLS